MALYVKTAYTIGAKVESEKQKKQVENDIIKPHHSENIGMVLPQLNST